MPCALRFREGAFKIVQITDTHWTTGGEEDQRTRQLIEMALDREAPDLVVLTGDIIFGKDCPDPARALRECLAPVAGSGIPWAMVFGNHDDEGSLDSAQLLEVQQSLPGCLTQAGPPEVPGLGNYVLSVLGSDGLPAAHLWFFYSGNTAPSGMGDWPWLSWRQVAWYRETSDLLARTFGRAARSASASPSPLPAVLHNPRHPPSVHPASAPMPLPALAFLHIPLPEFELVWSMGACRGEKHEEVCSGVLNSGLFAAMLEAGDVVGVFCGHEHINDFEGDLYGIRLAYGRGSGYGTYGKEGFQRGVRGIRLLEGSRSFETWVRLADGSVQ